MGGLPPRPGGRHERAGRWILPIAASYSELERLRSKLGDAEWIPSRQVDLAWACQREGDLPRAREIVEAALRTATDLPPRTLARMLTTAGLFAAHDGDGDTAESHVNRAIELVVEHGERNALVATALAAGRASQLLGRVEDAADAYSRTIALGGDDPGGGRVAPLAAPVFSALLGLQECTAVDQRAVGKLLDLLPRALDATDAWCDLPRLLDLLSTAPGRRALDSQAEQLGDALEMLRQGRRITKRLRGRAGGTGRRSRPAAGRDPRRHGRRVRHSLTTAPPLTGRHIFQLGASEHRADRGRRSLLRRRRAPPRDPPPGSRPKRARRARCYSVPSRCLISR